MDHTADGTADLVARFEREDDTDALDQAIAQHEPATGVAHGRALLLRYIRRGMRQDLDRGVAAFLAALEQTPQEDPERAEALVDAADALVMRWDADSDPADAQTAIDWYRQAVALSPESARARSKLGLIIARRRLLGAGESGDLAEALALCQQAVAIADNASDAAAPAIVSNHRAGTADSDQVAAKAAHLGRLALVMGARAGETQDLSLIQTAVDTIDAVLNLSLGRGLLRWGYEMTWISVLIQRYSLTLRPEDLTAATTACAAVLQSMPADVPSHRLVLLQYGIVTFARFHESSDRADREQAITVLSEAIGAPRPHLSGIERFGDEVLRTLLWNRVSDGPRLVDVDQLIARLRALLVDTPHDKELRQELYEASSARFSITADPADLPSGDDLEDEESRIGAAVFNAINGSLEELDAAISAADRLLNSWGHDDDRLDSLRISLSGALYARYGHRGDVQDLERSLSLLTDAIAEQPAGSRVRGSLLVQLALNQAMKYDVSGDHADLEAAFASIIEAAGIIAADDADRRLVEHVIGQTTLRRYRRDGDPADLAAAIAAYQAALDAVPAGHPLHSVYRTVLSGALQEQAESLGSIADNTAAISMAEHALRVTPAGNPRAAALLALARASAQRFFLTADTAAVDTAITAYQRAAMDLPPGHADRVLALGGLVEVLKTRGELTGSPADLDDAVAAGEQAWRLPGRASDRVMVALNLADALRMRSQRVGGRADVDTAMDIIVTAIDDLAEADPRRLLCELQLAAVLSQRFALTGDLADIDRCIDTVRSVLAALPHHSPARVMAYQFLGGNLWKRADHRGDLDDLNEAIDTMNLALAARTFDHRQRGNILYNKAGMLRLRFDVYGRPTDLDEAIEACRAALEALPPDHYYRPVVAKGLALLYVTRYDQHNPDDLPEIIRLGQEGLAATAKTDPSWASHQHVVGHGLLLRFWETHHDRDLRAAIRAIEASVAATAPDDPALGSRAAQLGLVLNERYERRGRRRDRDRAMAAFRLSAGAPSNGTLSRLEHTRTYAAYALLHDRPIEALEHYRVCVQELLPLAAWRGLGRNSQENQLKQVAGLAGEAAAAALACDSPRAAVQLLEQGRSVLWAQLLETRSDRSELRARHPRLAAEFDEVSAILDNRDTRRATEPLQPDELDALGRLDLRQEADRRRRATARFTELCDQIRKLPGFSAFLRPPDFATLQRAANGGPVVIVNVDRRRCDALLLTADDLRTLPLPQLNNEEAIQRARAFHQALGAASHGPAARITATQTVLATLEWLWDAVVLPILDALDLSTTPGGALPRIWWCPTGPLATLPLHAAGRHRPGSPAAWAGEHVVSSYTPTLQALLRARNAPPAPPSPATLVAALHITPRPDGRYLDLSAVPDEVQSIREALGEQAFVLEDGAATRQAVLDAIPAHPRVHFACHGNQNPDEPSASHLALHDADLTVLDLTTMGVVNGELAFLSACETAQGDTALSDESIHLAAAFHLTGYRHVIGTLWSLNDASAAEVAKDVYSALSQDGGAEPAVALHRAVARLRELPGFGSPAAWAPYVHIGM